MSFYMENDMILFSIVIPTYNREAFIRMAVDSVLSQTYPHWELIVVDDASMDDTFGVLSSYTDERISLVRNETNKERSASRNRGVQMAKGNYICFLDSDDYFLPTHLQHLADAIQSKAAPVALFYTNVLQIDKSKGTERWIERPSYPNPVEGVIDTHIPVIAVAIHHEILKKFNFDPQLKINEDVQLFSRIASCYPLIHIPVTTVVWLLHGTNTVDTEKDYLTPELLATRIIFNDPLVVPYLSSAYKKRKYFELYSRLVYFHAANKKSILSVAYFVKGIWVQPWHKQNKTNLLNVLYHLPGGAWLKQTVKLFKS